MPWINVIAQPQFGFQVSASGAGFTWSRNSRENALTTWSNDAVADPPSEALYVRDDDSGELWCPTAAPIRDAEGSYRASHGQGYSRFEYTSRGIALELLQFVPRGRCGQGLAAEDPQRGRKPRRLSVCAYAEWSLGASRTTNAPFIVTERCAPRPGRCWRATPGMRSSARAPPTWTWAERSWRAPATAASSSGSTAAWTHRRRCAGSCRCPAAPGPALTRAPRCSPRSTCPPAARARWWCSWARPRMPPAP